MTEHTAARTQTGGKKILKDILWPFLRGKASERGNPKALYKNQIAHSGLNKEHAHLLADKMYLSGGSSQLFIFLRTLSPGPKISLIYASKTPQQPWEELVLPKLTRVTCLFTAVGISQEPSVIPGQFLDFVIW